MIKTVGELLHALMNRERDLLAAQRVQHAPTIGAMYEGLTQNLVRRVLPVSSSISVVSGFAVGADGARSRQLDCMIVIGEGKQIPHTNAFEYPIDQVIAVIEVKKHLYQSEFEDSFQNLRSLRLKPHGSRALRPYVQTAFESISGHALPDDSNDVQDPILRQLLQQLMLEASSPARIILGYEGYKTAKALRRGLVEHLSSLTGKYGAGPSSLPDLILNPKAAVVKANGFPYVTHLADGAWPLMLSAASALPATTLLEVIWTRVNMRVESASMDFGADLEIDTLARLADYRYVPGQGWEVIMSDIRNSDLLVDDGGEWEPVFISDEEHVLLLWMARHGELDLDRLPDGCDPLEMQQAATRLTAARLIGPDAHRGRVLRQLTQQCAVVSLPDGRVAAGENVSGRLTNWVLKQGLPKTDQAGALNVQPDET
jgi:hypothetical protein